MNAQTIAIRNETGVLERCRAGEALAWKDLYQANFDFVFRVAKRLGTPDEEIEDVCQETFLVAYRKLGSFREGRITTWLYRIAANVVSQRHRRRRIRRALRTLWGGAEEEPVVADGPDSQVEAMDAERIVDRVLERMSPKKREVFALFEIEGLAGEEIAERVGCNVDTVRTRLHYARKDFERLVKRHWKE